MSGRVSKPIRENFLSLMSESLGTDIIELRVGFSWDMTSFWVHKKLLLDKIPFLQRQMYREDGKDVIRFPPYECRLGAFDLLVTYLYTGNIR